MKQLKISIFNKAAYKKRLMTFFLNYSYVNLEFPFWLGFVGAGAETAGVSSAGAAVLTECSYGRMSSSAKWGRSNVSTARRRSGFKTSR